VCRDACPVEPVEEKLGEGAEDESEKNGGGRSERVTPVHEVVGVRMPVGTQTVVDKIQDVKDGVNETGQQRVDRVVEADWNGVCAHVDDDVDRVEGMFQLRHRRHHETRQICVSTHNGSASKMFSQSKTDLRCSYGDEKIK